MKSAEYQGERQEPGERSVIVDPKPRLGGSRTEVRTPPPDHYLLRLARRTLQRNALDVNAIDQKVRRSADPGKNAKCFKRTANHAPHGGKIIYAGHLVNLRLDDGSGWN
jgi:hypothetical protein